jgi:hypothetical protein
MDKHLINAMKNEMSDDSELSFFFPNNLDQIMILD